MSPGADRAAPRFTLRAARWGVATTAGHQRPVNEDAVLAGPVWFAVADGMGGHDAGVVASRSAIDALASATHPTPSIASIGETVEAANAAVRARALADGSLRMGTTLVGATLVEHRCATALAVFHVGDSRCYRLRDGELTLLTTDHTHVQELVDAGRLASSDVASHPLRHVVTRALGLDAHPRVDVVIVGRPPGRLLLCSDGVSGELDAATIGRTLASFADPRSAADRLVDLVLAGPARDDATALVLDVEPTDDA